MPGRTPNPRTKQPASRPSSHSDNIRVTIVPSDVHPDIQEGRIVDLLKWLLERARARKEAA